jgi:phosphate transport system substrate-binding protein
VNFEYGLVANYQTATGMALALRTLLTWAVTPTGGNAPYFLGPVNFVPLPTAIEQLSLNQIAEISGP